MIKSYRNKATEKLHLTGKGRFLGLDERLALRRLDYLDSVERLTDIPALKSLGFHALKGDRKGQFSMRVNGPWRICFEWQEGDVYNVEITDYHKG